MTEHFHHLPTPDVPICDFCSGTPVKWDYPARNLRVRDRVAGFSVELRSAEGWAACDACHDIIESGNREELARRSARTYAERHPNATVKLTTRMARNIHDAFWANREGPPTPDDAT